MNGLSRNFRSQGKTIPVVLTTIRSAGDWLVNHIMKTDREMAVFLKQQAR